MFAFAISGDSVRVMIPGFGCSLAVLASGSFGFLISKLGDESHQTLLKSAIHRDVS